MRVLAVSAPLLGHVFPMVPLLSALTEIGHEVRVATGGDALRAGESGPPTVDVAPGFAFDRVARSVMLRHPLVARAERAGTGGTRGVSLLFGAVNDRIADRVCGAAADFRPDLVVYEPLAAAGAIAAARLGVPAVLLENSLFDGPALVDATAARLSDAMRRNGVGALPPPAMVLRTRPASMSEAPGGRPLRHVPYSGTGEAPRRLLEPDRPRILVSRSTVAGPGGGGLMAAVVKAATGLDAEVVLIRPERSVVAKGLPGNVQAVDWVPLAAVLPHCAALVHHGGAGGVLGALATGVPQLATPGPGDRRHNAELLAASGAGLAVAARDITTAHLERLLGDGALAAAASRVRDEIAAMPGPREVAESLESIA